MLKNISSLGSSLNKKEQKSIVGGLTEYTSHCGPTSDGLACLTGFPHCPTGICSGGVCSPHTNG